jgi:oligoribonuclease
LKSEHTIFDCENAVLNFLKENGIKEREAIVAGNSVGIDKSFIDINMPNLSAYLHYRIVDVSTIKELCKRWNPNILNKAPLK